MPKSSNQKLKLWYLYRILFENTDENNPITMPELITELSRYGINAERKSLYNDIELLVNAGVDIVSEKRDKFVYYMFIGALTEIAFTSINFWVPTYLTERLMYSMDASKIIFSAMGVVRSCIPFVALYVFKLFKEKDICMIKWCFILATVLFGGVLFITQKYINVVLFVLSLMVLGLASTVLWSVYIPSQSESNMVSTINGMLDFTGYAFAAGANVVFSFTMNIIGWNGIIVIWTVLAASGIVASVIQNKKEIVKG